MSLIFKRLLQLLPTEFDILQKQDKFACSCCIYNFEQPSQGIANQYPAEFYTPSSKIYTNFSEV